MRIGLKPSSARRIQSIDPMFLYLALAIRNRGYTNEVRLRGLGSNQGFQPAQAGFACVAATSSRLVYPPSPNLVHNNWMVN
ncbi:MAG: hypothetical protein V7K97_05255 [Nostoc sp.]|uniref:hypothetical protein n=1 Tax=Nostoc sp. TaxID=1180 RepID=UPI002FF8EB42